LREDVVDRVLFHYAAVTVSAKRGSAANINQQLANCRGEGGRITYLYADSARTLSPGLQHIRNCPNWRRHYWPP
jgi:hypothetical protein